MHEKEVLRCALTEVVGWLCPWHLSTPWREVLGYEISRQGYVRQRPLKSKVSQSESFVNIFPVPWLIGISPECETLKRRSAYELLKTRHCLML